MGELQSQTMERIEPASVQTAGEHVGRITVLEALAEETDGISINASRMSTQMGNGVDAEDD